MTDCVAFGIILDEAKEEHVLCIKKDDSNGPALSITTINTKLSKMLRCRLNLTDQPDGLATAIRCSLDEGKIQLDPLLQEICIQLPNHKLTEKMDVLSGSSQSEEIGTLLHSMIQRINKLEKTISKQPEQTSTKTAIPTHEFGTPSRRKRSIKNHSLLNPRVKKAHFSSPAKILYGSSSDSD